MVEAVGNAPTAAILQGSPAPLCCPQFGARGPYRTGSFAFSARRNDLICHPGWSGRGESNPASARRQRAALPLSYGRDCGGQGRSRTATDYAGRLQRLGLANAQPARDWLQVRESNAAQNGL
jgi:hypothetical protein